MTQFLYQRNEDGEVHQVTFATTRECEFWALLRSIVRKNDLKRVGVQGTDGDGYTQRLVAYRVWPTRLKKAAEEQGYFFK